jgi:hypothetical protein
MQFIGSVAPLKTSGKNKGYPNWQKRDKTTEKTFIVSVKDHEKWCGAWQKKTNKCAECVGTGKTIASCGANGTTYRECFKCKGTGTPNLTPL